MQRLLGLAVLAAVLTAGVLLVASTRSGAAPVTPPGQTLIPANFAKLGLTNEQKKKMGDIEREYHKKIAEAKTKLEDEAHQKMMGELTDGQKSTLKQLGGTGTSKESSASKSSKDSKKDDKKDDKK